MLVFVSFLLFTIAITFLMFIVAFAEHLLRLDLDNDYSLKNPLPLDRLSYVKASGTN